MQADKSYWCSKCKSYWWICGNCEWTSFSTEPHLGRTYSSIPPFNSWEHGDHKVYLDCDMCDSVIGFSQAEIKTCIYCEDGFNI